MGYSSAATIEIAKQGSIVGYELFFRPQNALSILSISTTDDSFSISGDYSARFPAGTFIYITGTAANDGRLICSSATYGAGVTKVFITTNISTGTAGGYLWLGIDHIQGSLQLSWEEDQAPSLKCSLPNVNLDMADQTWPDSFTALGCAVLAISYIGAEKQIEMEAEIIAVAPVDQHFSLSAADKMYRLLSGLTRIDNRVGPQEIVVMGATRRALVLIDPQYGFAYGLDSSGVGDLGFDAATGTLRRSWSDQGTRIWKDATLTEFTNSTTGNKETFELAQEHYRIDYFSGAVTILEFDPNVATPAYWIENLGAFEETQLGAESTTGGVNADFARYFEAMLLFPTYKGGNGGVLGGNWGSLITAVNTGAKRFTIAGDHTAYYKVGHRIYTQSSTGNDGSYSIASSSLSSGNTLIVVNEAVPSSTADGYITLDTGLDMPGLMPFDRGKTSRLISDFNDNFQKNIKPFYDADLGKWYLVVVTQKAAASEDWVLHHAKSIDQSRDAGDLYTGCLFTGRKAQPPNVVEAAHAAGTLLDDSTAGDWSSWNGVVAEADDTFANVIPKLVDGNATLGILLHNLGGASGPSGMADIDHGTTKYEGWWQMVTFPIDPNKPVQGIELTAAQTRQPRAAGGHQGYYWPAYRADISNDNKVTWYPATPLINGRFEPGSDISVDESQIPRRYGTHMRLLGGAYDHGLDIQTDPSVGAANLAVYQDKDYELCLSISPMHAITARATGASGTFSTPGDVRAMPTELKAGDTFAVRNNTHAGTNTTWTVASIAYNSSTDVSAITVTGTINAGAGANGELYTTTDYILPDGTTVKRDYPDIYDRFGSRIIFYERDLGDEYDEPLARVFAIQSLDDFLRAYEQIAFRSTGADPRIKHWQTTSFDDDLNGDNVLLVRKLMKTDTYSEVSGTNYLTAGL